MELRLLVPGPGGADVFQTSGIPTVPFSLGAFGWAAAARFVGTQALLFAGLPSTFKIGATCETATKHLNVEICGLERGAAVAGGSEVACERLRRALLGPAYSDGTDLACSYSNQIL